VVGLALGDLDLLPERVALEDVGVFASERLARDGALDEIGDLAGGRPDVLEIDRLAVLRRAERLGGDVDVHVAGDRIGDDERRRGEIVRAHVRVHPALEVAVAREHRGRDEIGLLHRLRDVLGQRPGIADAGGAAVADEVEAERVEILGEPRGVEIFRHDLAARGERGLDPGLAGQAERARLAGDEARADHHVGVRGVGAGGDRRDHHAAVVDAIGLALDRLGLVMAGIAGNVLRAAARRPRRTIRPSPHRETAAVGSP
jgi:hypothetical protein